MWCRNGAGCGNLSMPEGRSKSLDGFRKGKKQGEEEKNVSADGDVRADWAPWDQQCPPQVSSCLCCLQRGCRSGTQVFRLWQPLLTCAECAVGHTQTGCKAALLPVGQITGIRSCTPRSGPGGRRIWLAGLSEGLANQPHFQKLKLLKAPAMN